MRVPPSVLNRVWSSRALVEDVERLAGCGGRLAGSESEAAARTFLLERLNGITGVRVREHRFEYAGWAKRTATLEVRGAAAARLDCHPLIGCPDTPAGGLEGEVVDVGRGTAEEFEAAGRELRGRLALVRHEYPFAAGAIHRRAKYNRSRELGAAGFVIAGTLPGHVLVTGSAGYGTPTDIPAVGVSLEGGGALAAARAGARLHVQADRGRAVGVNLVAEVPGRVAEWVVVCAHYDGHDLAQSALDNATGVAAALQILAAIAPHAEQLPRGIRVVLFTVEEWGLMGSREYVGGLSDAEAQSISLVVNLDTLTGSPNLTCLTSGFSELHAFIDAIGDRLGIRLRNVLPPMRNSDHFSFVERGIPALRVVAGFDEPHAGARYLLTAADTLDKVAPGELKAATLLATELVWSALASPKGPGRHRAADETRRLLEAHGFSAPLTAR